nr:helix-turn-helix domain-containing protein [Actinomycetota bacterium]
MKIGASLHEARVRRRLTVDDAHRATRIRPQYLEALEEEDFERLPGDAYVKGFLRSYADYLELDGSALVATYRERNAERDLPPAAARPSALPPPRR